MRFTNSLRLLLENFKQVARLLVYKSITALVLLALCSALILPELWEIIEAPQTAELFSNVKNIFFSVIDHEQGKSPSFYVDAVFGEGGSLNAFLGLLFSLRWQIVLVCIGCVLVYLLKRFADSLVHFSVGSTLNDKMATYADTSFSTAFVENLGKASAYAGLYVPVTFLTDAATLFVACIFLHFLPLGLALFLAMTLIVVVQALKLTFTSPWLPAMTTDGKKLKEAIRYEGKLERKQIGKVFMLYALTVYIVIIVNVAAAVCTFGSALLLTVPASYFLLICEQYVVYYTLKGKKYFITYESIATNPDHGDRAHFFDYIEEVEKQKTEEEK